MVADSLCSHRVVVRYRGEIVELGHSAQVTEQPQHAYRRKLWPANLVADPVERSRRRQVRHELAEKTAVAPVDLILDRGEPCGGSTCALKWTWSVLRELPDRLPKVEEMRLMTSWSTVYRIHCTAT